MSAHALKQLQTRKAKLAAELARLDTERREAAKAYADAEAKLRQVEYDISNFAKEPVVSEHAIIRYMEREMGLDLELIRNEILTAERKALIKRLGDGKYPLGNSKAIVKDLVVVSIA